MNKDIIESNHRHFLLYPPTHTHTLKLSKIQSQPHIKWLSTWPIIMGTFFMVWLGNTTNRKTLMDCKDLWSKLENPPAFIYDWSCFLGSIFECRGEDEVCQTHHRRDISYKLSTEGQWWLGKSLLSIDWFLEQLPLPPLSILIPSSLNSQTCSYWSVRLRKTKPASGLADILLRLGDFLAEVNFDFRLLLLHCFYSPTSREQWEQSA